MDHTHVFIGGLHRSGTTLLTRCLAQHPQVSGFADTGAIEDEGQHLQTVYHPANRHGGPGRFGFHDAAFLDESSPLVSEANRRKLLEEWSPHWDMSKPVLVEKSPPNLIRTRFLQGLFPGSYHVVMMRESGDHPVILREAVTSPAGTTIAAVRELERHGVRAALIAAIEAARDRSVELGAR